jgi:hypothetical protein
MHNILNNTTISQGNVNITIKNREGKVLNKFSYHNSGTQALCKYIRDALSGDYVINKRPGAIIPCEYIENEQYKSQHYLVNMFSAGIDATTISNAAEGEDTDSDSWASVTLSCIIPETVLTAGKIIGGFRLYSINKDREEYAWLDIHNYNPISIEKGTNIEVEWTLKVSPFAK